MEKYENCEITKDLRWWRKLIQAFAEYESLIFIVLSLALTAFLLPIFVPLWTSHNENVAFTSIEDIQTKRTSYSQIAHIHINGTYKKNDVKYYIFTTDISGDREFTLSEYEYDKYIGLDNNMVDCSVYTLNCYSDVYSLEYSPNDFIKDKDTLKKMLNDIKNVSCGNCYEVDNSKGIFHDFIFDSDEEYGVYINYADGVCFEDFIVTVKKPVNSINCHDRANVSCKLNVCRYSFIGESEFSEEEINRYLEIMKNLNIEIVERCRNEINEWMEDRGLTKAKRGENK